MNPVLKTIAERSSIRAYRAATLKEEEINALLTAGLQAPTARNMQEIHISVLHGAHPVLAEIEEEKRKLAMSRMDEKGKEMIRRNPDNFYYNAPHIFMLSADRDFFWSKLDAGICAENISLEYFAEICQFPKNYEFAICVAVGYRNTEKIPHGIDMEKSVSFIK